MEYTELIADTDNENIEVVELDLGSKKECGKCIGNIIFLNKEMNVIQKKCVLAEELGHFYTTVGDITGLKNVINLKEEQRARRWSYKKLIPLCELKKAYEKGLKFDYEIAEELGVTITFLKNTIDYYKCRGIDI